jgi:hypothetical protein
LIGALQLSDEMKQFPKQNTQGAPIEIKQPEDDVR